MYNSLYIFHLETKKTIQLINKAFIPSPTINRLKY